MLEAALGPLSAPAPVQGERDLRSSDRRRGEALVTLVRRAVATAEQGPRHTKSQLFVTVDLETLRSGLREAGVSVGGPQAGTLLAPETVRRLACDATIVPTVLGVAGAVVDLGTDVRLFTSAQIAPVAARRALHVPGLRHAWSAGRCASPAALGGWRTDGSVERGLVVRTAPHGRAQPAVCGRPGRGRARGAGRVGPDGGLLRPAARRARNPPTSVTPPRAPLTAAGRIGMSGRRAGALHHRPVGHWSRVDSSSPAGDITGTGRPCDGTFGRYARGEPAGPRPAGEARLGG